MQSGAGEIPMPHRYLQEVRRICDKHGALLIYDEIQCFCRTGSWFGAQTLDVEPDIIVFGKAVGAGFPLAGIIIHDRLKGFDSAGEELHTFSNNQASMIAALKQLEIIERDKLLEHANRMGTYIRAKLENLQHSSIPEIGDIRQLGLKIGLEINAAPGSMEPLTSQQGNAIVSEAAQRGCLFQLCRGNVIKIKPALIITEQEADEAIGILAESIRTVLG
jgi:4-aminobutyrate aminotransferase-like enzyme